MKELSCPHCGNTDCFIEESFAKGLIQYRFSLEGNPTDNSSMYDLLSYKQHVWMICEDCGKKAIKTDEFMQYYRQHQLDNTNGNNL